MKCYTVTEKGVATGIPLVPKPYPHVGVGNPEIEYDYRRVPVDPALATSAANGALATCSMTLDATPGDHRRSCYKLVGATGTDDDKALVKLAANGAGSGGRTYYELPRYTLTLASGWVSNGPGPKVSAPVNLVVLEQGAEVRIMRRDSPSKKPEPALTLRFDGDELRATT